MNPIAWITGVIFLILGAVAGYFFHRYQADTARKNQQEKADNILKGASEQARLIESQARENAVKIVQAAEGEINDRRGNEIDKLHEEQVKKLEFIAQMTPEDARKELFAAVEKEARGDMARIIRQIEAEAREQGEKRARKLIADAIQRVASEHVAEVTRAVVTLPN